MWDADKFDEVVWEIEHAINRFKDAAIAGESEHTVQDSRLVADLERLIAEYHEAKAQKNPPSQKLGG